MADAPKSYLTFRVARKDLAVEAAHVRGILPFSDLVRVPRARPGLLGVVTLDGCVINVVNLAQKLHLPESRRGKQPKVVVMEVAAGTVSGLAGFIVDRVADVVTCPARDVYKGVLHGSGRPRKLIDFQQMVSEGDLAEIWALIP